MAKLANFPKTGAVENTLQPTSCEPCTSFPRGGIALVLGASGAIGNAIASRLLKDQSFSGVLTYSRSSAVPLDLCCEASIELIATDVSKRGCDLRLVIDATGILEGEGCIVEKSWRQIDTAAMARAFAVNAIGPALLMKNFLPLLPREGKSVFATLSARVGSISDNRLGGWYSYRASKAALNQIVRTASIELQRTRPAAFCVAIHPGTVDSRLSKPFTKSGLEVQTPDTAAQRLIKVLDMLAAGSTGGFIDQHGRNIGW